MMKNRMVNNEKWMSFSIIRISDFKFVYPILTYIYVKFGL